MTQSKPQYDEHAESAVMGAMLLDNNNIDSVMEVIKPESFYLRKNQDLFRLLCECYRLHGAVDVTMLNSAVMQAEKDILVADIVDLYDNYPATWHVLNYAETVKQWHTRRKLKEFGVKCMAESESVVEIETVIGDLGKKLCDMVVPTTHDTKSIKECLVQMVDVFERQDEHDSAILNTGFVDIDNILAGLREGELIIIAANRSFGKTTLALNIARNNIKANKKVLLLSLETSSLQITKNMVCGMGRIDSYKMRTGRFTDKERSEMLYYTSELSELPFFIDDTSLLTITALRNKINKAIALHGVDLIIVDYLQLIDGPESNDAQRISNISRGLKVIAREHDLPLICLAQLNRENEHRVSSVPKLSDLRGSGSIEQDADIVMFLYPDDEHDADNHVTNVKIAKHRNGSTGIVQLHFEMKYLRFDNLGDESFGSSGKETFYA
ncbi:MAG: replicative DNA helicase [Candidatus Anammoxibacter sp.]